MGQLVGKPQYVRQGPCIVIYGPPGIGKTSLIAGLATALHEAGMGPVLHADWELSTESVVPLMEHIPTDSLKVWMPDLMQAPADEGMDMVDTAINIGAGALVVDTIGAFAQAHLDWLTTRDYTQKAGKATLRPGVRTPKGMKIVSPTMQDYGMAANAFLTWMRYALRLRNKGIPLVLIGHERLLAAEDEAGQTIDAHGGPEFVGRKLTREFDKLAQVIVHGRYVRRPGKPPLRVMDGETDGIWAAKDRLHLWPKGGYDITAETPKDIVDRATGFWRPVVERLKDKSPENGNGETKKVVRRRRRKQG